MALNYKLLIYTVIGATNPSWFKEQDHTRSTAWRCSSLLISVRDRRRGNVT